MYAGEIHLQAIDELAVWLLRALSLTALLELLTPDCHGKAELVKFRAKAAGPDAC